MKTISILKTMSLSSLPAAVLLVSSIAALAGAPEESLCRDAEKTILQFKNSDSGLAGPFEKSAGFIVFPNVGRGGVIFGGEHGQGVVYEKGKPVGTATLTEVTFGLQLGGQALSEVIFFEDPEVLKRFKHSPCELSAEASAVAVREGAASKAQYQLGVLVFTRPKAGLMVQAAVGGQKFTCKPTE